MVEGVELYCSWTVDQLKAFLQERQIPLSGNKEELVKKVAEVSSTTLSRKKIGAYNQFLHLVLIQC